MPHMFKTTLLLMIPIGVAQFLAQFRLPYPYSVWCGSGCALLGFAAMGWFWWRCRRLAACLRDCDGRLCFACHHDLRRIGDSNKCPECGEPFDPATLRLRWSVLYWMPALIAPLATVYFLFTLSVIAFQIFGKHR